MKNTKVPLYTIKKNPSEFTKEKITSSSKSYEYIKQFYFDDIDIYESFFVLLLNSNNQTIGYSKISQGGILGAIVDIRLIAKYAIDSLAVSVILAHNHPSGSLVASVADKEVTRKVKDGLALLDIKVLDHIILTNENYYSFADNGLL